MQNLDRCLYLADFNSLQISELAKFVSSSLSVFAGLLVFFTVFYLKTYKEPISRMIIAIIVADFGYALVGMLLYLWNIHEDYWCNILSGLQSYARVSSFCWSACFAHAFFLVMRTQRADSLNGKLKWYLIGSLALPIFFPIFIMSVNYYRVKKGMGLEVCQHTFRGVSFDFEMFIIYSLPTLITFLYTLGCYLFVCKQIRRAGMRHLITLLMYSFITLICWGPYLWVQVLKERCWPVPNWLLILASFLCPFQGVLDSVMYGLSYGVVSGYKEKCKKYCKEKEILSDERHPTDSSLREVLMKRSKTAANGPSILSSAYNDRSFSSGYHQATANSHFRLPVKPKEDRKSPLSLNVEEEEED